MKINFAAVLLDLDDEPLKIASSKSPGATDTLTLGRCAHEALFAPTEQARNDSQETKFKCFELAREIKAALKVESDDRGVVEITPEDVAFIKTRIANAYGPNVLGPAFVLLNG